MSEAPSYALALLRRVKDSPEITQYLQQIDATLRPFDGMFLIHGGPQELLEGTLERDVILIRFPDRHAARAWYDSHAYQQILPLRQSNLEGPLLLIDGVPADHQATDILGQAS